MISLKRLQFMKQRMAEQKTVLSKWIFISISLEILFFHLVRMKWKPCSQRKHAERKRLLKERENLLRNLRRKEIQKRAEIKAKTEAGDQEAQSQLAERKQYQVRATVKSYRKMRDDALSGDPIAKVRYEKTLAMRREAYHSKKSEQTA